MAGAGGLGATARSRAGRAGAYWPGGCQRTASVPASKIQVLLSKGQEVFLARAGRDRDGVQGAEPIDADGVEEGMDLLVGARLGQ